MKRGLWVVLCVLTLPARAQVIQEVNLRSWWNGLGASSNYQTTLKVADRTLNPSQADAFAKLLRRAPQERPDLSNLGVTEEAIQEAVDSVAPAISPAKLLRLREALTESGTAPQTRLSAVTVTAASTDDYPHVEMRITLDRGEVWTLRSDSQEAFMLPWTITLAGQTFKSYDADISRALAAWLPADERNRGRILGSGLDRWIRNAVLRQVPAIGLNFTGPSPPIRDVRVISSRGMHRTEVTFRVGETGFDAAKIDLLARSMVNSVEQVKLDELGLGSEWLESLPAAASTKRATWERILSLAPGPVIEGGARVEAVVTFQHGEQWRIFTESTTPFMLPWVQETMHRARTFDPILARTVAALLPTEDPNRALLLGSGVEDWAAAALTK